MTKEFTFEQVEKALVESYGVISEVARKLKCSRTTIYNYLHDNPELENIRIDQRESLKDLIENSLIKKLKAGDTPIIIFAAKTILRDRGYAEKQDINVSGEVSIKTYVTISPDQWDETS